MNWSERIGDVMSGLRLAIDDVTDAAYCFGEYCIVVFAWVSVDESTFLG